MTAVLAIDQGTSATKALVLDPEADADGLGSGAPAGILAVAEVPVAPEPLPGGGVEQDPYQLLESVREAGRRAVADAGHPRLGAVALANQGETVLAWDRRTGRPRSRAVVWQDRRSEALCAERAHAREWVRQRSGLVLDPYFSAPKMAWLRANVTRDGVVTTTDSWLLHRLTGGDAYVTDLATASRSLLLDLDGGCWDGELAELFGLGDEELPRLAGCDEVVGTTTEFGRDGREVPVAGIVVDQQAALFAEGCLTPGTGKCTYGTGAFLLANTGTRALRPGSGLTSSVAWRLGGEGAGGKGAGGGGADGAGGGAGATYCVDGQVYTAASAVRWLTGIGLIDEPADVDTVAAAAPDGAGSVLCVPALAGLAAPWWRPDATASFTGMTLATGREHLVLAVIQGIAAQVAELAALVEADLGAPLTRLRADGGLTRSRILLQAQADLAQVPVDVYPSAHATALGAAALGRLATEPELVAEDAVAAWAPSAVVEPRWSAARAAEHLGRWREAVAAQLARPGPEHEEPSAR